jgi:sugar/nucleoside kinase (ribokinase family)
VAELVTLGVGCAAVRRVPGTPTGSVVVLVADGERSMLCDRGANALLSPADIDAALAANPDAAHLHLSGYVFFDPRSAPAGRHALAAARARGLTTSVDAASAAPLRRLGASVFAEWVAGVDILLANLDEALVLATRGAPGAPTAQGAPDAVVAALADLAEHVVVKRGAEGAVWADATGTYRVAAQRVDVAVDPTGAGDAFAAGLLAAWLTGADPAEALTAGAERGARAVQILGGRPGIDGRPSIDGRGVGPARPRHDHPSQDQRNLSHIAASESIHHRKM